MLSSIIDQEIEKYERSHDADAASSFALAGTGRERGVEFEIACRDALETHGWVARLTPASGDQGVDVIAQKGDIVLVVQCKLRSSKVGNTAVQEIIAGKAHYRASHAAVVSNSEFTPAARALAASCDVILLHPDRLRELDAIIAAPQDRDSSHR